MKHDEKHVITGNATVIWDGITRPDVSKPDKPVHSLKVALAPGSPEIAEIQALVQSTLNGDPTFKGVLPPGGQLPFIVAGTDKPSPDPQVDGYTMISAKTRTGAPTVHDISNRVMSPMEYGAMLYPGAIVRILVHAFAYNTAGNTGVALGIDGVQIIDATVPKLAIAAGVDTVAAFGGAPQTAPGTQPGQAPTPVTGTVPGMAPVATAPPAAAPPAAPARDFLNPPVGVQAAPVMTPKAGGHTYEAMLAANWTDEQLIAQGYMTR